MRNDKVVVDGRTYRAHDNMLVVSRFGSERRYPAHSRKAARAHAELIAADVLRTK